MLNSLDNSSGLTTDANADTTETSCSGERPPNMTSTVFMYSVYPTY